MIVCSMKVCREELTFAASCCQFLHVLSTGLLHCLRCWGWRSVLLLPVLLLSADGFGVDVIVVLAEEGLNSLDLTSVPGTCLHGRGLCCRCHCIHIPWDANVGVIHAGGQLQEWKNSQWRETGCFISRCLGTHRFPSKRCLLGVSFVLPCRY